MSDQHNPIPDSTSVSPPAARVPRSRPDSLLWFSAFILLGLVIVQTGRLASHWSNAARGDLVSRVGDYTTLTLNTQGSEDMLVVLDGRGESVYTYRIQNQKQVELVRRYDLGPMFITGQRIGAGRAR